MAVSIDRVIIMINSNGKKNGYIQSDQSTLKESTTFIQPNRIVADVPSPCTEANLIETRKLKLASISNDVKCLKKKTFKIKIGSKSEFVIQVESFRFRLPQNILKITNNDPSVNKSPNDSSKIETLQITNNSRLKKKFHFSNLDKRLVDWVIFFIVIVLFIINGHYLWFLRLTDISKTENFNISVKYDILNITLDQKKSSSLNNMMESIINQELALKRCYATQGTMYEKFLDDFWFWIDLGIYSLIPFIVNCISSLIIAIKLKNMNKNYKQLLRSKGYEFNKNNYMKKIKKNRQICLMLLNQNLYFLFSMVQFWVLFFVKRNADGPSEHLIQSFVYVFLYTNNAFDFMIYGFSSSKFRKELFGIFYNSKRIVIV